MAVSSRTEVCVLAVLVALCIAARTAVVVGGIIEDGLELDWGQGNVSKDGQVISLYLDRDSGGSGLRSRDTYLYARTDLQIKLVPNNSAGTVTTFFFLSEGPWEIHDEIDLEFLGNVSGQPYTLHTNIFANGTGQKEEQFRLWFDPATDFHTYSIVWTPKHILVLVDGTPIREFRNHAKKGVAYPYPSSQRMRLFGSLWNADDWATQGGRVKTDWSAAPFLAQYRNFKATTSSPGGYGYYDDKELDGTAKKKMERVREEYMIYNYCTDTKRFPNGVPPECSMK
ncbi:hypothetical protein QYE76_046121 [Lolium multiflorum]|uniref:Xyloglucan endotransglucosylase/hydrolase n=1 Tax=Lolium multiflorum TaxID=4521 RepID=A0AAD8TNY1_LOLMU|nr:hypothetical protein QYE76_046121 [Lolium multiflorum]